MPAPEFLVAIRSGRNEEFKNESAFELLWLKENRFKSINSFRQIVDQLPDLVEKKNI